MKKILIILLTLISIIAYNQSSDIETDNIWLREAQENAIPYFDTNEHLLTDTTLIKIIEDTIFITYLKIDSLIGDGAYDYLLKSDTTILIPGLGQFLDSLVYFVRKSDSTILFITPKQLMDSLASNAYIPDDSLYSPKDTINILATQNYVSQNSQSLTLGMDNQIPVMNAAGTDFEYDSEFTWVGGARLNIEHGSGHNYLVTKDGAASINGSSATYNDAFGYYSLASITTGDYNVGFGSWTNGSITTESGNTAIGAYAGTSVEGDSNIFIGNFSGYCSNCTSSDTSLSHKLVITNTRDSWSDDALIYGEFDNDLVRVNGTFIVRDTLKYSLVKHNAENVYYYFNDSTYIIDWFDDDGTYKASSGGDGVIKILPTKTASNKPDVIFGSFDNLKLLGDTVYLTNDPDDGNAIVEVNGKIKTDQYYRNDSTIDQIIKKIVSDSIKCGLSVWAKKSGDINADNAFVTITAYANQGGVSFNWSGGSVIDAGAKSTYALTPAEYQLVGTNNGCTDTAFVTVSGNTIISDYSNKKTQIREGQLNIYDTLVIGSSNTDTITHSANKTIGTDTLSRPGYQFNFLKTYYYSVNPAKFTSTNPDVDDVIIQDFRVISNADGIVFYAPVNLPDGATITGAILYGTETDENWFLERHTLGSTTKSTMAEAAHGTEDTSISNATIDNSTYSYCFRTSSMDTNDIIYGARITFTLSEL